MYVRICVPYNVITLLRSLSTTKLFGCRVPFVAQGGVHHLLQELLLLRHIRQYYFYGTLKKPEVRLIVFNCECELHNILLRGFKVQFECRGTNLKAVCL